MPMHQNNMFNPPQPHAAARQDRLAFVDALRAYATLAVFVCHMLDEVFPAAHRFRFAYFDLGTAGVTIFFLTSGFIIPLSLERTNTLAMFWARRFLRLFPAYWFSLCLLVLCYIAGLTTISEQFVQRPIAASLAHLTMFPSVFGFQVHRFTLPLVVALIGATAAVEIAAPLLTALRPPPALIGFLVLMFSGTIFYRLSANEVKPRSAVAVLLAGLLVQVLAAFAIARQRGDAHMYLYLVNSWIVGYVLFTLVYINRKRAFSSVTLYLGRISYSIYLVHPIMLLFPINDHVVLTLMVWTIATLVLSAAVYRWVEYPGILVGDRLKRSLSKQGSTSNTAVSGA